MAVLGDREIGLAFFLCLREMGEFVGCREDTTAIEARGGEGGSGRRSTQFRARPLFNICTTSAMGTVFHLSCQNIDRRASCRERVS